MFRQGRDERQAGSRGPGRREGQEVESLAWSDHSRLARTSVHIADAHFPWMLGARRAPQTGNCARPSPRPEIRNSTHEHAPYPEGSHTMQKLRGTPIAVLTLVAVAGLASATPSAHHSFAE